MKSKFPTWESHLVRRAAAGESVAFELICDQYRAYLYHLALRRVRNPEDAADIVQETLLKALRAIPEFDSSRPLSPWLTRICINCCIDTIRERRREGESLGEKEQFLPSKDDIEVEVGGAIREKLLLEAVARLPLHYRNILMMRHLRHMEVAQIAQELGRPEGTIKSWLFRARALLKKDVGLALG